MRERASVRARRGHRSALVGALFRTTYPQPRASRTRRRAPSNAQTCLRHALGDVPCANASMTAPGADEPRRDEVKRQRVWPNVIQSRAEATRRDAQLACPRRRSFGACDSSARAARRGANRGATRDETTGSVNLIASLEVARIYSSWRTRARRRFFTPCSGARSNTR